VKGLYLLASVGTLGSNQAADTFYEFDSMFRYRKIDLQSFSNILEDPMSISEVI